MTTQTRWGIVSTGRMAEWFCDDFGSVHNGQLGAVCSRKIESAQLFANKYNIPKAYGSYDELLADNDIDVVYIATPHTAHKQGIIQALNAGKNVVCEKPLVTRVADAHEVFEAARRTNRYLMEALWTWHLPAMQTAKAWVRAGRIGRLVHVKTDFGYPVPYSPTQREYEKKDAGGALREMGIYPVAIARWFIDKPYKELHVVHQEAPNGVEYDLTAVFDYGDITATLATSFRCRMRNAAYILGEEGYIVLPDAFRGSEAQLFKIDDQIDHFQANRTERGYHYQAIAVGEDIMAGRLESPIVSHQDSLTIQQDMAAILNKTGRGED